MTPSVPDPTHLLRGDVPPEVDADEPYGCPRCGQQTPKLGYVEHDFACPACGLAVAHLDRAPNGAVRQVLGWLRRPGEVLEGRYRVVALLGKGGFAATYAVEDLRLTGKRRALKEVPKPLFDERESEILSKLHHPGIPDIMDRFGGNEMVYLVLEFAGSRTLETERVSHGGKVPPLLLLTWMRELCDVLGYLHRQTPPVVHRDLKPENVLLNEDGRVMLIDFGIAKESDEAGVTRTLALSASLGFSPPEQVLGTGTDQRSDVYSLAATAYALLTGAKPTPAHERVAGTELPTPSSLTPETPAALETLILRSLDLNIHQRVQSIREFAQALGAIGVRTDPAPADTGSATVLIERGEPLPEGEGRSPKPRVRRWQAAAGLALAALAALAGGTAWWMTRSDGEPPAAVAAEPPVPAPAEPAAYPEAAATPPSPPSAQSTGSALEALEARRTPDPTPAPATTASREVRRPAAKAAPAPAAPANTGWGDGFRRQGATRTD